MDVHGAKAGKCNDHPLGGKLVSPALGTGRQRDPEFKASLCYTHEFKGSLGYLRPLRVWGRAELHHMMECNSVLSCVAPKSALLLGTQYNRASGTGFQALQYTGNRLEHAGNC